MAKKVKNRMTIVNALNKSEELKFHVGPYNILGFG